MKLDKIYTMNMRENESMFSQRCEKLDTSIIKIELVIGTKKKNKKGHRKTNPCKILPAYI